MIGSLTNRLCHSCYARALWRITIHGITFLMCTQCDRTWQR